MPKGRSSGFIQIVPLLLIALALFGVVGGVAVFGYPYIKSTFLMSDEQKCCLDCNKLAYTKTEPGIQKTSAVIALKRRLCTDYSKLSKKCLDQFQKDSEKNYQCANLALADVVEEKPLITWPKSKTEGTKLDVLKNKYKNTLWKGTIQGSLETYVEPAGWYGTANYTLDIEGLKINFDDPEIANFSLEDLNLPLIGKITYNMGQFKCVVCCNSISDPFNPSVINRNLVGQISFDENEMSVGFDESKETIFLNTQCDDANCEGNGIIPQELDLADLVGGDFKIKMEGEKIVITGCLTPYIPNVSKCTASGSLNPK